MNETGNDAGICAETVQSVAAARRAALIIESSTRSPTSQLRELAGCCRKLQPASRDE